MHTWLPMMSSDEIEIISALLAKKQPKRILEWGSGNSTVFFSKLVPTAEVWTALEHKRDYVELLSDRLPENAEIILKQDMSEYINYPRTQAKYDFILVDGEHRDACLEVAFDVAKKNAIILLHDCDRKESFKMMKKYEDRVTVLIHGEKPQRDGFMAHRGLARFKIKKGSL